MLKAHSDQTVSQFLKISLMLSKALAAAREREPHVWYSLMLHKLLYLSHFSNHNCETGNVCCLPVNFISMIAA